jgi:hypothetical protein
MNRLLQFCALAVVLTGLPGCDTLSEMVTSNIPQSHGGRASLVVSLRAQEVYLYRSGQLVATSRVSSGREGHRTPLGQFRVIRKEQDHRSSLYGAYCDDAGLIVKPDVDTRRDPRPPHTHFGGASIPYFMEFAPGYGLHQGYLPGLARLHPDALL